MQYGNYYLCNNVSNFLYLLTHIEVEVSLYRDCSRMMIYPRFSFRKQYEALRSAYWFSLKFIPRQNVTKSLTLQNFIYAASSQPDWHIAYILFFRVCFCRTDALSHETFKLSTKSLFTFFCILKFRHTYFLLCA